jgi:hypothetical protein
MQSTRNFFRQGWFPIAAVVIVLLGAFWILKPVEQGAVANQESGQPSLASVASENKANQEDSSASPENQLSSSAKLLRTEASIERAPSSLKLLVVDTDGNPVPDLRIAHRPLREQIRQYSIERPPVDEPLGVTNHAGVLALPQFVVPAVPLVTQNSNWLVVDDYILHPPFEGLAKIVVRGGGSISGIVVGENGPVDGAVVKAQVNSHFLNFGNDVEMDPGPKPSFFDSANYRFTHTDQAGRFQIQGLLPDSKTLHILAEEYAPFRYDFPGPQAGANVDLGSLTLEPGTDVTFHFTSASPLEEGTRLFLEFKGSQVSRGAEGLLLDAAGKVEVGDLHPGPYQWDLERPGAVCTTGHLQIYEESQDVHIAVAALRSLEVKVIAEDGLLIEDVGLKAYEKDGRRFHVRMDGSFFLSCSEGKRVNVKASADGFVASPRIRVPATESFIEIVLQRLGQLQIHLVGMDDRTSLQVGVQAEDERSLGPLSEQALLLHSRSYAIENRQVLIDGLEPGTVYLMLDLGAGPTPYGPFVVKAGEITQAEIEVLLPREISGVVRDQKTHAPIAGAAFHHTSSSSNDLFRSIAEQLGVAESADAISNAEGQFTTLAAPTGVSYFSVVAPHYETKTVAFSASNAQPYQVELTALPSASLRVLFSEQQAAANAVVGFISMEKGLPSSIASVSVDENGEGIIDSVPAGACQPSVSYQWNEGVQYRVGFPSQRIRDNQRVEFSLVENPGWLTLEELPQGKVQSVSIRSAHAKGNLGTLIRCDSNWWQSSRAPLPISPGAYRVTAISAGKKYLASCTVRSGETTHVIWDNQGEGQITVELTGGDWTTCQLALLLESGDFAGEQRHLYFDRTPQGMAIENLAEGKYLVRLVAWTDLRGNRHKPDWSQRAMVKAQPGAVHFRLDAAAKASILVVDENGTPLERALVACAAVNGSEITLIDGITNKEGRLQLLLPIGEVIFRTNRADRRQKETRLHHSGEGEVTLVCPSRK